MTLQPLRIKGSVSVNSTYAVTSPVDGVQLAEVDDAGPDVVDALAVRAREAARELAAMSTFERRDACYAAAAGLERRADHVAEIIVRETGRTLASAHDEVAKAASGLRLAGEEGIRLTGQVVPVRDATKLTFTSYHPTGTWALLSPWNFPLNIPVEYLGPALALGNPVIWKPAPSTASSAHVLWEVLNEAGFPADAVTLLTTDQIRTAQTLVSHPDVVGVGLTGASATGDAVARLAAGKRLVLELGGNGPVIVHADADLARAARAIAASGFAASGQICSATGRVLADAAIADELAEMVAAEAETYVLGDPFDPATVIGPVHDMGIVERVDRLIDGALADGARRLTAVDRRAWPTPHYLSPTVVTDVRLGTPLEAEESFGPVVPVVPVSSGADMVAIANSGVHALSVALFTSDLERAMSDASRLEFGSVVVNDRPGFWELHLPFGGWYGRSSGTGRVGVGELLRQMAQLKTTSFTYNHP